MNRRVNLLVGICAVITFLVLSSCVWYVRRDVHYSFSYGRMVNRDIETHLAPLNQRLIRIEEKLSNLSLDR